MDIIIRSLQRWARNFNNVAPQNQNALYKTSMQDAKRNCVFDLFKGHCTATINAKNASFHNKFLKRIF
jgi:hypothetical protein